MSTFSDANMVDADVETEVGSEIVVLNVVCPCKQCMGEEKGKDEVDILDQVMAHKHVETFSTYAIPNPKRGEQRTDTENKTRHCLRIKSKSDPMK